MSRLVIALFAGGCFAPDPMAGAPCASADLPEEERCPSGLVCVDRGAIETCEETDIDDDRPVGDRDGDAIIDDLDNCPDVKNTDQANEDRDPAGDACDPCPPFEGIEDVDQDGVGDACDPNPTSPGDKLVAFNGFTTVTAPWTASGMFLAAAGEAFAMAGDNESAIATVPSPNAARVEVRTQVRLISIAAASPNLGSVSIVERFVPDTDRGVACQLSALASGDQQQLRIFDLDKKAVVDTAPHPVTVGELDLRLRRARDQYNCRATTPVLELAGSTTFAPPSGRIGVRVRGATAMFHWVMVVTSP